MTRRASRSGVSTSTEVGSTALLCLVFPATPAPAINHKLTIGRTGGYKYCFRLFALWVNSGQGMVQKSLTDVLGQ